MIGTAPLLDETMIVGILGNMHKQQRASFSSSSSSSSFSSSPFTRECGSSSSPTSVSSPPILTQPLPSLWDSYTRAFPLLPPLRSVLRSQSSSEPIDDVHRVTQAVKANGCIPLCDNNNSSHLSSSSPSSGVSSSSSSSIGSLLSALRTNPTTSSSPWTSLSVTVPPTVNTSNVHVYMDMSRKPCVYSVEMVPPLNNKRMQRSRGNGSASQFAKRCSMPACQKISVSRGLCRGHGGGRRCHHEGCNKGAQSRSDFCWSHGGGQRCEADGCKRSRKSKRFCVTHVHLEDDSSSVLSDASETSEAYGSGSTNSSINSTPPPCKRMRVGDVTPV